MALFRLLHISDLHISTREGEVSWFDDPGLRQPFLLSTHDGDVLAALAEFAHVNRDDPGLDAVLVSGDLASRGDAANLQKARDFLCAPATSGSHRTQDGQPTLGAGPPRIWIVPGNHDRFGPKLLPGGRDFDTIFAAFWRFGQNCECLGTLRRGGAALALVGVDLTLASGDRGSGPYFGQGRAYRHRMEALGDVTWAIQRAYPKCAVVWVIHFRPNAAWPLQLLDMENLEEAVGNFHPAAIICGHTHDLDQFDLRGTPVWVCGTTTQRYAPDGNWLQVIQVDVDPELGATSFKVVPYRYVPEDGFVRAPEVRGAPALP